MALCQDFHERNLMKWLHEVKPREVIGETHVGCLFFAAASNPCPFSCRLQVVVAMQQSLGVVAGGDLVLMRQSYEQPGQGLLPSTISSSSIWVRLKNQDPAPASAG